MLGIRFMKAAPTTYVLHYAGGRLKREGAGLSFFYWAPGSTIAAVPVASVDVPFAFEEKTADFQSVTIQGQLTYRVTNPRKAAAVLDFSLGPDGGYQTEDPARMDERLVRAAQVLARTVTERRTLREALASSDALAKELLPALKQDPAVSLMGLEVLSLAVQSVRPTPEMARALEAEAREALQGESDEAIYERRNAAVEQERKIKENELNTEIAVEEKRRQVRETQMAAEIAVEERRRELVERRVENDRKDADSRSYALEAVLKPIRGLDWKTLMAVTAGGADPKLMIALAFRELAENAQKIGELNVTPDLLKSLIAGERK
jgi:hypothetical protein